MTDAPPTSIPGRATLGPLVQNFDQAVDRQLERARGHPLLDRVFTTASHVGEFSLIWQAINLALGVKHRRRRRVVAFAVMIGLESLVVNQGIKRLFNRTRPTPGGDRSKGLEVRTPLTSSFPSGHASAAAFAASMLAPRTSGRVSALIVVIAGTIATSRAYVRIHHASDVVAGVATGWGLALLAKRIIRRLGVDDLL